MSLKKRFQFYFNGILDYFKDNLLLFLKPKKYIQKLSEKKITLKLFLINIILITIIHSIFNYLASTYHSSQEWDFINLIGVTWQILVFVIFVLSFAPLVIDFIASKISKTQNQLIPLFKIFYHSLLIFAFYPLVNLLLLIFNQSISFYLPFSSSSQITWGQIFEAIILCYISIFIIHYFYKSKMAIIFSLIVIGFSFPIILYGWDFVLFLKNDFYYFKLVGILNNPANIILWCMENMWFCLLILFLVVLYFKTMKKNPLKSLAKTLIIPNLVFPGLIALAYLIVGAKLPIAQLTSLIISSIAAWNFIFLIYLHYSKNLKESNIVKLDNWELFMGGFWLITISLSFSLIVSFISAFFCLLFCSISFIYIKFQITFTRKWANYFYKFIIFYIICLMGSTTIFFFIFSYTYSVIAIEWPTFFSFIIAIPISLTFTFLLKISYFYPLIKEKIINQI